MTVMLDPKMGKSGELIMPNKLPLADPANSQYRRIKQAYVATGFIAAKPGSPERSMSRSDSAYELASMGRRGAAAAPGGPHLAALTPAQATAYAKAIEQVRGDGSRALARLAAQPKALQHSNFTVFWLGATRSLVGAGLHPADSLALQREVLVAAIGRELLPPPAIFVGP